MAWEQIPLLHGEHLRKLMLFIGWLSIRLVLLSQHLSARIMVRGKYRECEKAAILVSAALYGFAEPLYRLFTTDSNVVRIGADMMHFLLPSYFMYVVIGILSGALRGAGRVLVPMLLTCGGVCLIRIAWMFGVFPVYSGIKTIMLSYPVSWGITAVLFIIYYFKKFPKTEEQILQ